MKAEASWSTGSVVPAGGVERRKFCRYPDGVHGEPPSVGVIV